jgi:hypothetical protein
LNKCSKKACLAGHSHYTVVYRGAEYIAIYIVQIICKKKS